MADKPGHTMTKQEMLGSLVAMILVLLMIGFVVWQDRRKPVETIPVEWNDSIADSIVSKTTYQKKEWPEHRKTYAKRDTIAYRPHAFDPNTADSVTLVEVGVPGWMARMMLKYRRKGGRYKAVDELQKIPYMTDSIFERLKPYVAIDTTLLPRDTIQTWQDSTRYVPRIKKDTILDLNTADTTELQWLRGVGRYTAMQIVIYRDKLGGYVHVDQVEEIPGIRRGERLDSIKMHLRCDSTEIRRIAINYASIRTMMRHPYMTYDQAEAVNKRAAYKRIKGMDDLRKLGCFTEDDLRKLEPYISF